MLSRLFVKNIALIDSADIEFDERLNVLSGETGSGKSVILDSINFVLGSKADKSMIRYGESEATVKAEFIVSPHSEAARAVCELDIDCDGQIIITRKFNSDGRGSIKINGNSVTASMLKSVTLKLVDVHGQSEHFFLLNEGNQLKVIDSLCAEKSDKIKGELAVLLSDKKEIRRRISTLGGDEAERERRLDILDYQIKEIEGAHLECGEYEKLRNRLNMIRNSEKILSALNISSEMLSADQGCIDLISTCRRNLAQICDISEAYGNLYSRLEDLYAEAEDISRSLADAADEISFDEREAQSIEERIDLIEKLFRKYGADEESVISFAKKANEEYQSLINSEEELKKLNSKLSELDDKIFSACVNLTKIRKECAKKLCEGVVCELKSLNITNAEMVVDFNQYTRDSASLNSSGGEDSVCFMFSANKGEPLKPLSKVISGGEMSRLMLAIKTRLKDINGISTYIFDEIDAGISGMTAVTVAKKFIDISSSTQIIAVSHLPQVCAASDCQFLIYKTDEQSKTVTKVKKLSRDEKVAELIRLTGNIYSDAAKEHAEQLMAQFGK